MNQRTLGNWSRHGDEATEIDGDVDGKAKVLATPKKILSAKKRARTSTPTRYTTESAMKRKATETRRVLTMETSEGTDATMVDVEHQAGRVLAPLSINEDTMLTGSQTSINSEPTIEDGYQLALPDPSIKPSLFYCFLPQNVPESVRLRQLMLWCAKYCFHHQRASKGMDKETFKLGRLVMVYS
jgi:hypothetical protein